MQLRIGTWNIHGRKPTDLHLELLRNQRCDVWLLTEVHADLARALEEKINFQCFVSDKMPKGQYWAVVACPKAVSVSPLPNPRCDDVTYCASVLPWEKATDEAPWAGSNHEARVQSVLRNLLEYLPRENLVWGGDWNHTMSGNDVTGNMQGRSRLLEAVQELRLVVPTANLPSQVDGAQGRRYLSIDHIAVPASWNVRSTQHISCKGISDHDAYLIDVDRV